MAAEPTVSTDDEISLVFGQQQLQLEASPLLRRGGLRVLAREVETEFGLSPGTYAFHNPRRSGEKIQSLPDLQRALEEGGLCVLEVRESSEGKIMREVRETMHSLEGSILAKVAGMMAKFEQDVQHTTTVLSTSVGPMVQSLAEEQLRLRARFDGVDLHKLAAKVDDVAAKCETALAGLPLRSSLDASALDQLPSAAMPSLQDFVEGDLGLDLEELSRQIAGDEVGDRADLQLEMQSLREMVEATQKELKALEGQVQRSRAQSARDQDLSPASPSTAFATSWEPSFCAPGVQKLPWAEPMPAGIPYSSKALSAGLAPQLRKAPPLPGAMDADVPLSRGLAALKSSRPLIASRSVPQSLPPLH